MVIWMQRFVFEKTHCENSIDMLLQFLNAYFLIYLYTYVFCQELGYLTYTEHCTAQDKTVFVLTMINILILYFVDHSVCRPASNVEVKLSLYSNLKTVLVDEPVMCGSL